MERAARCSEKDHVPLLQQEGDQSHPDPDPISDQRGERSPKRSVRDEGEASDARRKAGKAAEKIKNGKRETDAGKSDLRPTSAPTSVVTERRKILAEKSTSPPCNYKTLCGGLPKGDYQLVTAQHGRRIVCEKCCRLLLGCCMEICTTEESTHSTKARTYRVVVASHVQNSEHSTKVLLLIRCVYYSVPM